MSEASRNAAAAGLYQEAQSRGRDFKLLLEQIDSGELHPPSVDAYRLDQAREYLGRKLRADAPSQNAEPSAAAVLGVVDAGIVPVVDEIAAFARDHGITTDMALAAGAGVAAVVVTAGVAGVVASAVRGRSRTSGKSRKQSGRRASGQRRDGKGKRRKLKFGSPAWRKKYGRKKSGLATESGAGITGTVKQYRKPGGGKVRYAKNGTPYVIGRDGRPRFIKGKRRKT